MIDATSTARVLARPADRARAGGDRLQVDSGRFLANEDEALTQAEVIGSLSSAPNSPVIVRASNKAQRAGTSAASFETSLSAAVPAFNRAVTEQSLATNSKTLPRQSEIDRCTL